MFRRDRPEYVHRIEATCIYTGGVAATDQLPQRPSGHAFAAMRNENIA